MSKIRFGLKVHTINSGPEAPFYKKVDWKIEKEGIQQCEELGYDTIWCADHLILGEGGFTLECWTTLSSLASLTESMRVGTLMTCNLFRHPALLAKMGATLDVITNGRFELGIGAGWIAAECKAYGIPYNSSTRKRIDQMKEAVIIIKKMWTESKPCYKGKYYKINKAICEPKPLQKPHPPIWMGGGGEKYMLRTVAELADGYNYWWSVENYEQKLKVLQRHCTEVGRNFEDIKKSWDGHIIIASNESKKKHLFRNWLEEFQISRIVNPPKDFSYNSIKSSIPISDLESNAILGTPDKCLDRIQEYVNIGITDFVLWFADWPSLEGARLFSERVIPSFK